MRASRYSRQGQRITASMLRTLYDTGPGGLIIAQDTTAPFTLTHSRDLDLKCPDQVIIYGHGDLTHELACGENVWTHLADEATEAARPERDLFYSRALGAPLGQLREHMRAHGMDLTHRPVFDRTEEGAFQVEDVYALRDEGDLTIGASCVRGPGDALQVQTRLFDQGRPVNVHPACTVGGQNAANVAEEMSAQVKSYLTRNQA
ncbi:hypothetical protein NE857_26070 [Nocardiopsis exhalans]|uniref:Uncharacterized protein n=2 Tax=Nocardiopsis TaxID=2013 RepID=A0A840WGY4_9ACTN|nr:MULTISPECIES: hypothetical protein [Nocardiopsis]MBB5492261.1 hypothetical protein [Nocardiopsis metallicus]USY18724.1 hypothetical protein NE857_26070 [Nocardiopsis exhalans]